MVFHFGTLEEVYQHLESCTSLATHFRDTIPYCHSIKKFSITKAYVD